MVIEAKNNPGLIDSAFVHMFNHRIHMKLPNDEAISKLFRVLLRDQRHALKPHDIHELIHYKDLDEIEVFHLATISVWSILLLGVRQYLSLSYAHRPRLEISAPCIMPLSIFRHAERTKQGHFDHWKARNAHVKTQFHLWEFGRS